MLPIKMTNSYFKAISILLFLFLISQNKIFSQNDLNKSIRKYVDINKTEKKGALKNSGFYIIKEEKGILLELEKKNEIQIIKRLEDGYSIIKSQKLKSISSKYKFSDNLWFANDNWKLSPILRNVVLSGKKKLKHKSFLIRTQSVSNFKNFLKANSIEFTLQYEYLPNQSISILLKDKNSFNKVINCKEVLFIDYDLKEIPEEESYINLHDLSVNSVNVMHNLYPSLDGAGLTVSVKERLFDVNDIDIRDRAYLTDISSDELSQHATRMATIIGGAGNSSYKYGKGAAWKTLITSSGFTESLLPDRDEYYNNESISVQNHSYGLGFGNYYNAEAEAFDINAYNNPTLLHVFSSGNSGASTNTEGKYSEVDEYSNISGNFKMGKNYLLVGAVEFFNNVGELSSRGPAYDGRLKPDLVAYGLGGTSDAAAIVSGISLLLQDAYKTSTGTLPTSALLKSFLISGAKDVAAKGIDFISGYGNVNAFESLQIFEDGNYIEDIVVSEGAKIININVPDNTKQLIVSMVWNDPAASVDDNIALVNDLDLVVKNSNTGEEWLPWCLSTFPHIDSLSLEAIRKEDHLNNVEYVTIDDPVSGNYELNIAANILSTANQSFAISYRFVPNDNFYWTYPTSSDPLEGKESVFLRWESNLESSNVVIELNLNSGDWFAIENDTSLVEGLWQWEVPDTTAIAQLRINDNGVIYESEKFTINSQLKVKVGANCTDDFNLFWEPLPNVLSYDVSKLENGFFEPFQTITNTTITLDKSEYSEFYYAVTPIFISDDKKGMRSLALDYTEQGVNCYYTSFFGSVNSENTAASLSINLSSIDGIKNLFFERDNNGVFDVIHLADLSQVIDEEGTLVYHFEDTEIVEGVNYYRARIVQDNGNETITDESEIYYAKENTLVVFPNPVRSAETISILSNGGDGSVFHLYTTQGKLILNTDLPTAIEDFPLPVLPKGIYIYRNYKKGKQVANGKLVIY